MGSSGVRTNGKCTFVSAGGEIRAKRLLLLGGFLRDGRLLSYSFGCIGGWCRGHGGRSGEGGGVAGESIITALLRMGLDDAFLQQDSGEEPCIILGFAAEEFTQLMGGDGGGGLESELYEFPRDPLIAEMAAPGVVCDAKQDGVIGAASEGIGEPAEAFEARAVACAEGEDFGGV